MSDLISRSALIEVLEKELGKCKEVNFMSVWSNAMRVVENQPTTYDVERVVEQLEDKKWNIHDWRDKWRNEIIDECIEVVKGGVDNE